MNRAEPDALVAGRYRLHEVVGRGGMGVVWRATDEVLRRFVAVKEIIWPPHLGEADRDKLCERALREARAAARLDHPSGIRVYDVVEDDGRPWIVMPLIHYPSLGEVMREHGRPATDARWRQPRRQLPLLPRLRRDFPPRGHSREPHCEMNRLSAIIPLRSWQLRMARSVPGEGSGSRCGRGEQGRWSGGSRLCWRVSDE